MSIQYLYEHEQYGWQFFKHNEDIIAYVCIEKNECTLVLTDDAVISNVPIDIKLDRGTNRRLDTLNNRLGTLNTSLKQVSIQSKTATQGVQRLDQATSSLNSKTAVTSAVTNKATKSITRMAKQTKVASSQMAELGRVSGFCGVVPDSSG